MSTTLYDAQGNEIFHHDLQDKLHWCAEGESKEQAFVRRWGAVTGYQINPAKEADPYAPDLFHTATETFSDLKSQHSPFFKAGDFYDIDPTYAVVFNLKDRHRYQELYPHIDIVYYVEWLALSANIRGKQYKVNPFTGIYRAPFKDLLPILDQAHIHSYSQRRNDTQGNAKNSYVLDIRHPVFQRLL